MTMQLREKLAFEIMDQQRHTIKMLAPPAESPRQRKKLNEARTKAVDSSKFVTIWTSAIKLQAVGYVNSVQSVYSMHCPPVILTICFRCKYNHDVETYLASKPPGLRIPTTDDLLTEPPFVRDPPEEVAVICPLFLELGECKCAFNLTSVPHINVA